MVSRKSDFPRHAKRHAPNSEYVNHYIFFGGGFCSLLDVFFFFWLGKYLVHGVGANLKLGKNLT